MISLIAACVFVIQVGRASENQGASKREAYATASEVLGPKLCGFRTVPTTYRIRRTTRRTHYITPPVRRYWKGGWTFHYEGGRRGLISWSTAMNQYCIDGLSFPAHPTNVAYMRRYAR